MAAIVLVSASPPASAQSCTGNPLTLQILGSGGPGINRFRASTSYLLWVGDRARILVDMGGGAHLRFGQAQARLADLDLIAISHLHPDHVSDLPALLWLGGRARSAPLPIVGPTGNATAPSLSVFLQRLFDGQTGAFPFMALADNSIRLAPRDIDAAKGPVTVFEKDGITVTALAIPHGSMPTLAYRVTLQGASIVLSSDQTGTEPTFVEFARGAHVLVMHLALAEADNAGVHAGPAVVGRIARDAGAGRLVLSHIGPFRLEPALAQVTKDYAGALTVGADLQCTPVQ